MRHSRRFFVLAAAVLVSALSVTSAFAASVHFKKGGEPVCTISNTATSTSASCSGTLAGLSGQDLSIPVTLSGFTTFTCTNQGGNEAAGQNKVLTGPTTTPNTVQGSSEKNGNVTFSASGGLVAQSSASATEAGCPNNNWSATNPHLTTTGISLQIIQGNQLVFTCTASNPNGLSGTVALSC